MKSLRIISLVFLACSLLSTQKTRAQWTWQYPTVNADSSWMFAVDTNNSQIKIYAKGWHNIADSASFFSYSTTTAYVIREYRKGVCNGPAAGTYFDSTFQVPQFVVDNYLPIFVEYFADTFMTNVCTDHLLPTLDTVAYLYRYPLSIGSTNAINNWRITTQGNELHFLNPTKQTAIWPSSLNCVSSLGTINTLQHLGNGCYSTSNLAPGIYSVLLAEEQKSFRLKFCKY
ncbi:MAG: hypothetical protein RL660_1195 [Bacteroidota bacterium]